MGSVRISRQTQRRGLSGSADPGGALPANGRLVCVEVWASRVDTHFIRSEYAALLIERPRLTSSSVAFDSRLRRELAAPIHPGSPLGRSCSVINAETIYSPLFYSDFSSDSSASPWGFAPALS